METGIDGIGAVITNSPILPRTDWPCSSYASTATPRQGADSSPGQTGTVGTPPMNADTTSVPPLIPQIRTSLPRLSCNQIEAAGGSVDPVTPTVRSRERSY